LFHFAQIYLSSNLLKDYNEVTRLSRLPCLKEIKLASKISFEIDNTRKIIKEDGVDPTIAVNENPMFICWVQNRHYLIVDLLVDFFKEFVDASE
jgi:hypothetical protein